MADIHLISILPQQGIQPSPISQGAGSQTPLIQVHLPAGSVLSGFIINRDNFGNPVLRTESGDITFHSNIFLKIGSEVVIRLIGQTGAQQARIISIDGKPPEAPPPRADNPDVILSRTLAPEARAASPAASQAVPPTPIPATVVSPAPASPAVPALPAGTPLAFKIISLEPAGQISSPAPAPLSAYTRTAVATSPSPNPVALPAVAPAAPPTAALPITAPTPPDPRAELLALAAAVKSPAVAVPPTLPAAAAPIPAAAPAVATGQIITATVIAHEPTGETLLQTPLGVVRFSPATPIAIGSKVTLETALAPLPQTAAPPPVPAPFTEIAHQWASMQQIAQLLGAQLSPLQGSGAAITPREISSGLLLFIAALKGGNFRNWLGDSNIQWLQTNGHTALLKKAEAEFISMARSFFEPPAAQPQQPWQALVFPLAAYGAWQQVRIFVKRDREPEKKQPGKKQGDTRFVVEMTLSQLGEMQMDGFVRRSPQATEFDLFIRSHTALSQEIQQEISRIYSETGSATGYRGSLIFQAVREFPVNPMEEIAEHMAGVIA